MEPVAGRYPKYMPINISLNFKMEQQPFLNVTMAAFIKPQTQVQAGVTKVTELCRAKSIGWAFRKRCRAMLLQACRTMVQNLSIQERGKMFWGAMAWIVTSTILTTTCNMAKVKMVI